MEMQVNPRCELLSESRRSDATSPNAASLAGCLQLGYRKLVYALHINGLVVSAKLS